MRRIVILVSTLILSIGSAHATDTDGALNYLQGSVQEQGEWGPTTPRRDTSDIGAILFEIESSSPESESALDYLAAYPGNIDDYRARTASALLAGSRDASGFTTILVQNQNADGGWGISAGFDSDPLDTALALTALNIIGGYDDQAQGAITYLLTNQNTDGGWGPAGEESGSTIKVTNRVLMAIEADLEDPGVQAAANNAHAWLLANRNADGTFGSYEDPLLDTAFATYGLLISNSDPAIY